MSGFFFCFYRSRKCPLQWSAYFVRPTTVSYSMIRWYYTDVSPSRLKRPMIGFCTSPCGNLVRLVADKPYSKGSQITNVPSSRIGHIMSRASRADGRWIGWIESKNISESTDKSSFIDMIFFVLVCGINAGIGPHLSFALIGDSWSAVLIFVSTRGGWGYKYCVSILGTPDLCGHRLRFFVMRSKASCGHQDSQ